MVLLLIIVGGLVAMAFLWGSPMQWLQGGANTVKGVAVAAGSAAERLLGFSIDALAHPQPGEEEKILRVGTQYNVDPRFLAAIRLAENGRAGREFGVLSVPAPTYDNQLSVAASTVAHRMSSYTAMTGLQPTDDTGRLTDDFIGYFGNIWAPPGASNDPNGLNSYWVANVQNFYGSIDLA
jgi:hypothetical protein